MALSEKSRSALYQGLVSAVRDEEAVAEMMAYFPARDVEEPVTKEHLRAEMSDLRSELRGQMSELRAELRGEMSELRAELRGEMADLRSELRGEMSELRVGMSDLRADVTSQIHRSTIWTVGAITAWSGVLLTAVALLR